MPEIPASASGVASTDDDDDEDEGHYDVISKSRRAAAAANTKSSSQTQKPRFCHPYEIVAGDSDSTYAGIREELEAVISLRNSRVQASNHPTAAAAVVAHGISDPLYAGITIDSSARTQELPSVVGRRPRIPSTYSSTINNSQVQRLHVGGDETERPTSSVCDNDADSPLLPPRNGNIDSVDGVTVSSSLLSNGWAQLTTALSAANTANSGFCVTTTTTVHANPGGGNVQEIQRLHNSATADAMPVTGNHSYSCKYNIVSCGTSYKTGRQHLTIKDQA